MGNYAEYVSITNNFIHNINPINRNDLYNKFNIILAHCSSFINNKTEKKLNEILFITQTIIHAIKKNTFDTYKPNVNDYNKDMMSREESLSIILDKAF